MRETQLIQLEAKRRIGRQENDEERAETVYQQSKGDRRQREKHSHVNMEEAGGRKDQEADAWPRLTAIRIRSRRNGPKRDKGASANPAIS